MDPIEEIYVFAQAADGVVGNVGLNMGFKIANLGVDPMGFTLDFLDDNGEDMELPVQSQAPGGPKENRFLRSPGQGPDHPSKHACHGSGKAHPERSHGDSDQDQHNRVFDSGRTPFVVTELPEKLR